MRLKSCARSWRQIAGLQRMTDPGEMAIYKAGDGTILCKLVGWLRREDKKKFSDRALMVRTAKDAPLVAFDTKAERIWVENCEQLPRRAQFVDSVAVLPCMNPRVGHRAHRWRQN